MDVRAHKPTTPVGRKRRVKEKEKKISVRTAGPGMRMVPTYPTIDRRCNIEPNKQSGDCKEGRQATARI